MVIPSLENIITRVKGSALVKDSFWALLGSALGKGLSLLAGILVARFLGKEMYGQYGIIKNTLLNIAVFSTLGLGYTGTRFIARSIKSKEDNPLRIIKIIYLITFLASSVIALAVFVFSKRLAIFIKAPDLDGALRLTSIIIVFNAVNTSQIGVLSGFKAFKTIARNNTIAGIVTFLCSAIMAYYWALDGALWALLLCTLFNVSLNYASVKHHSEEYTSSEITSEISYREIILFSIPIALQESLYTIVHFASSYLLISYGGYGELGITSAAAQWSAILLFLPSVMQNVMLSYFSSSSSTLSLRNKMITINFGATFVPWVVIALFSGFITSFYGETYDSLRIVLIISCLNAVFSSVSNVIVYEFISLGKNWEMFLIRFARDFLSLLLAWYLLSTIRSISASIVSSSVYTLCSLIFALLLWAFVVFHSKKPGVN